MVVFPNGKINLGLNVIRKRGDGYRDLETVLYPIDIADALEIIPTDSFADPIQFSVSGLKINIEGAHNLCVRSFELLKRSFPQIPPVKMHLHKTIPVGAGLGGGSSDASFALKLFNQKFNLNLSTESLLDLALQLGSDCPFFIIDKPCFAIGRGEFLERVNVSLSGYKIILVNPGIHVSTAEIFSVVTPSLPSKSIKEIIQQPIDSWKIELANDLEEPVFKKYGEVKQIKDELYKAGAIYASMSGSGSTVYGIFTEDKPPHFFFPSNYFVKTLKVK